MSSPDIQELLPPPRPAARPVPWNALLALFVPAAALAAGTGLQRLFESASSDPVLHWLGWSSGAGLAVGALPGLLRRQMFWPAYGLVAPWLLAGLLWGLFRV